MPYWTAKTKPDRDDIEPFDMQRYDSATGLRRKETFYRLKGRCMICTRILDEKNEPESLNCGGDCLRCMAEAGDPECVGFLAAFGIIVEVPKTQTVETPKA